ncbi:unnamed protein product [Rhizophagus irregularis]|nr:unnamed protein product [Rhizophagus irregularis]
MLVITFCEHKWYYENLLSGNGFQRVRECQNNNWKPYILINKHKPSKLAIQNASHKPILCWFHIMKTFSENLNKWQIPAKFRYLITLAFKIVEWRLSFIDAGRISKNITNRFPWTTNNFTEQINRTIEAVFESGLVTLFNTQTIEQSEAKDCICL